MKRLSVAIILIAVCLITPTAIGYSQTLTHSDNTSEFPIEIEATNGIEWERNQKTVRARGNARATRGDLKVNADILTAHYREQQDGNTEIWRIDAAGNVEIVSSGQVAYADHGTYDVDSGILDLTADDRVKIITTDGELTADESIRFFSNESKLIASGSAEAVKGNQRLRAPVVTIFVAQDEKEQTRIQRMEAENGVQIATSEEFITGNSATYNADTGIAEVSGSVKITRGPNQLNGCGGKINLNTGISTLFGCGGKNGKDAQVRGLIQPRSKK